MSSTAPYIWDSYEWESYGVQLLQARWGVAVVPVPDGSGGDGGLDAYVKTGATTATAWQCYAPENEPLKPKPRYVLQRSKITSDLKKLVEKAERIQGLLGPLAITEWFLLTPQHESSDLVAHCATKTTDMRESGLAFLDPGFSVHVQCLRDFAAEHRQLQGAGILPDGLHKAVPMPNADPTGQAFENVTGPLIDVMDGKLKKVVGNPTKRAVLRAEYLRAQLAGEDKLGHFEDAMPQVAEDLRDVIARAKRRVMMDQALNAYTGTHLATVTDDLSADLRSLLPELSPAAVEQVAQASVTRWLQECSMDFDAPSAGAVP